MITTSSASTIEHRFQQRMPLNMDVVIFRNHIPIAVGKIRDISNGGMGIDSEIVNLKKFSLIEIEVGVNQSSNPAYHRLSGVVVHHHNNGFGILFSDLSATDMVVLQQLMLERYPGYSQ
ncbi:MAG: PilZ domain-containing protein [Gammaproteobacteria bacterium]|jgi:hypothetical protein|nr:PilZ domain-containing protein [Gammaproteobacteria bacterium]